jgi:hypothetical protein
MKAADPLPPGTKTQQIALRVPLPLLERIDAYAERIRADTRMFRVTRTEAALVLIRLGLEAVEKKR